MIKTEAVDGFILPSGIHILYGPNPGQAVAGYRVVKREGIYYIEPITTTMEGYHINCTTLMDIVSPSRYYAPDPYFYVTGFGMDAKVD